jgi:thiosulfate/3-mercaptopyruvate sulfurtransferase
MRDVSGDLQTSLRRRTLLRRCVVTGSILAAGGVSALSHIAMSPAMARRADSGPPLLVDAAWLRDQQAAGAAGIVLLDLGDLDDYRSGHLPGAVHSYWLETVERDYDFYGTVLNQYDDANELENQGKRIAWMRRYGIKPDDQVVAYDHGDGRRAARIVWFLYFLGHTRASMLDGGAAAWRAAGGALETKENDASRSGAQPVVAPQSGFYVATTELTEALADPATLLVDIRTDDERSDTIDGQFATGVIPGSARAPWTAVLRQDEPGLLPADAVRSAMTSAGLDPARRIILYGRFGCDTNLTWLALQLAGYSSVEIYDRGWVEWVSTSGLPVEPLP